MAPKKAIGILVVAVVSIVCWQAAQSAAVDDKDAELYRLFVDAVEHVGRNYVKEVDRRELIEAAIAGMLDSLDPHSNYFAKEQLTRFERETTGKFGGIGVQIADKPKNAPFLRVVSPLVGTPAYEAGILADDRIVKVNGESVEGLTQTDIVERLTGPPGTKVTLTVSRRPFQKTFDVDLNRAIIHIESIYGDVRGPDDRWDFVLDKENKIGYVRLNGFIQSTKDDLEKVLRELLSHGMRGLVLDLRYNPGGLLSSAVDVSDLFLREGVIVSVKGRNTPDDVRSAQSAGTLPDFPIAVLVNRYSASASEIVAAALQDHKRAIIVGERTFGKGSVQNVIELEGGKSALKLTTASYRRPNGHNIHRFKDATEKDEWGVSPDKGFAIDYSPPEHSDYLHWRQHRDLFLGKASALKKVQQDTEKDSKPASKPQKPDSKEKAKPSKESKSKTEEAGAAEAAAARPSTPKSFDDRQLNKALEYLRGQLSGKVAKAANTKE